MFWYRLDWPIPDYLHRMITFGRCRRLLAR